MSRTPETDGEWNRLACQNHPEFERNLADFARKLERERDEWKSKYIQQNKDLGCEMMDPNGTIWDYAKKLQRELTAVTKKRDEARTQLALTEKNLEISTRQTEQAVQDRADEHIVFTLHWDEAQKTIESLTTTAFDLLALLGRAKSLTIPNPTND